MTAVDPPADAAARPKPPRWVLPVALGPILTVVIASYVAGSVWAVWVNENPLGLVLLSPVNRILLLTTPQLDFWEFFLAAVGRHLFPDPFFFLLGHYYGARALRWASEGSPMARRLVGDDGRGLENPSHRKILYPLAFLIPNNYVSLLCGSARIPVWEFALLNLSGTIARVLLCRVIGDAFTSEIRRITDFIGDYQWAITGVSVVIVAIGLASQLRPGGQLRRLTELDDE